LKGINAMLWIQAYVAIFANNPQIAIELVSDIFFDLAVKGVVVDDPDLTSIEGWAEDAVKLPEQFGVMGYFPDTPRTAKQCKTLEDRIEALKKRHGGDYRITYQRLDEADWAEAWKEFFWPQRITSRLVVKPTWREFKAKEDDIVIEIDPGMAFGTGTHASTALCLAMLEKYLTPQDRILDIGTGSGILMIAAARLGARMGDGIDNDEVAVKVARQNLRLNQIDPRRFKVGYGDLSKPIFERYDVITANILSEVILVLLDDILRVIAPDGRLICSGIIAKNSAKVRSKITAIGLETVEVASQDEWVAIMARKNR
jgi:ribosomal protein L11 methyltransferase